MENKYQNGKIYKVVDNGYNKTYYGSTIEQLCKRIGKHRGHYKEYKKGNEHRVTVYDIFDEFGVENCKIELVELYPCNSISELKRREGEVIRDNECVNKVIAGRTVNEWKRDNIDRIHEIAKNYRQRNYDKCIERSREAYRQNREHALQHKKEYYSQNVEVIQQRNKMRYDIKRDEILEQKKDYYRHNKDVINEKQKEKTLCSVCNSYIRKRDMNHHLKTLKH